MRKKKLTIGLLALQITVLFLIVISIASYVEAQDHFRRNISLEHFNKGVKLEKSGDIEKAILEYEKAIDADPYNPYPFLNLGTIYFYREEPLLAKYYYWISLKNDPSYQTAQNNLNLSEKALIDKGILDPERAFLVSMERGESLDDIFKAAKYAGYQLVREGKISTGTFNIISRELMPLEAFIQDSNQSTQQTLDKLRNK